MKPTEMIERAVGRCLRLFYRREWFTWSSRGPGDQYRGVLLNDQGVVDGSMLDLSDYVLTADLPAALAPYVLTSSLPAALAPYALLGATNIFTASQQINNGVTVQLVLNATSSGVQRALVSLTNGSPRWVLAFGNPVAESGSNAGSDFALTRFSDAGGFLTESMTINRATGTITFTTTTGGLVIPRMTTTQRNALTDVVNGMTIYNTTTGKFQGRAAGSWVDLH